MMASCLASSAAIASQQQKSKRDWRPSGGEISSCLSNFGEIMIYLTTPSKQLCMDPEVMESVLISESTQASDNGALLHHRVILASNRSNSSLRTPGGRAAGGCTRLCCGPSRRSAIGPAALQPGRRAVRITKTWGSPFHPSQFIWINQGVDGHATRATTHPSKSGTRNLRILDPAY